MLTKYRNDKCDKLYKTNQNQPSFCQPPLSSSFRRWCFIQFVFVRPIRIVFTVICVIVRIVIAATMCRTESTHRCAWKAASPTLQLRSQPDLQLHVMRWSNVSGAGSPSAGSGVWRPSLSVHSQSVGFNATPRHCCTWWYTQNEC